MSKRIITSSPDVMGGTPVFAGTRVPVQTLLDYLKAGESIDDFLDGFPTVTGVLAVPPEHRAYASATGTHAIVVVEDSTLQIVAQVAGPQYVGHRRRVERQSGVTAIGLLHGVD